MKRQELQKEVFCLFFDEKGGSTKKANVLTAEMTLKSFSNNRLTSEKERGIILINKDMHAIFI